jgi:hypothetical protein
MDLTVKELKFADAVLRGMSERQAAKVSGLKEASVGGHVIEYIGAERDRRAREQFVSRHDVIEGLKEGIEMGRLVSDPGAMISGWREIGKMLGYYEPERRQIDVAVRGSLTMDQLQALPDHELLKIIEGEALRVEERPQLESR